jgi:hypothetical protein
VVFHCTSKPLSPISPPPSLKLNNLSEDHIETSIHPQLESDVCLCARNLPGEWSSMPSLKQLLLSQRYLFCSCNRVRSSVPFKAGWFPNFRPHAVLGLCAHRRRGRRVLHSRTALLKQSWSRNHPAQHNSPVTTFAGTSQNRCYCGQCGNGALSSMSSSYGSSPETTRFPSPLDRPGVPTTTLTMLFIQLIFEDPLTSSQGAMRLGPQIQNPAQILSFWRGR